MEASSPQRKTTTTIDYDGLTLEFSKNRGEMRLRLEQDTSAYGPDGEVLGAPSGKIITLPLWAILEIRDWCAVNLPMMGSPETSRR
jgi:hypothetical protein